MSVLLGLAMSSCGGVCRTRASAMQPQVALSQFDQHWISGRWVRFNWLVPKRSPGPGRAYLLDWDDVPEVLALMAFQEWPPIRVLCPFVVAVTSNLWRALSFCGCCFHSWCGPEEIGQSQ